MRLCCSGQNSFVPSDASLLQPDIKRAEAFGATVSLPNHRFVALPSRQFLSFALTADASDPLDDHDSHASATVTDAAMELDSDP